MSVTSINKLYMKMADVNSNMYSKAYPEIKEPIELNMLVILNPINKYFK